MANPIDNETGKPRRGRPRNSDRTDANGSGTGRGVDNSGSGIPDTGIHDSGSGNSGSNGTDQNGTPGEIRQQETDRVTVEAHTEKPKRSTSTTRKTTKGAIQPKHVETWIVQGFALVAMLKNAEYWAIANPKIEVEPWAEPAAELINKISGEHAQKIAEGNAVLSVCLGMFALVSKRLQLDAMYAKQRRAQVRQAQMQTTEETPPVDINPDIAAERATTRAKPGSGANNVGPRESIFGDSMLNLRD